MARTQQVVVVDDTEFEITKLGGVEGLEIYDRLCKELGPTIAAALRRGALDQNAEMQMAVMIIESLAALPADFKRQLWNKFAGLSKVKSGTMMLALGDGKELAVGGVFDQHFAGRFGHMTRWLLACMKWSFGDFLPSSAASTEAAAATT